MAKTIDSRGLDCPQPVINAKKALEQDNDIIIIVDNTTAVENLRRLAENMVCKIHETKKDDGFYLQITKENVNPRELEEISMSENNNASGPTVITISDDSMGGGERELGNLLIQGFIHRVVFDHSLQLSVFSYQLF